MRNIYLIAYDICDQKRLRKTFKVMRRFGDHLQYSVFRCILSDCEKIKLRSLLREVINTNEDQILIVDMGPEDGRGDAAIETLGLAYSHPERHVIIV